MPLYVVTMMMFMIAEWRYSDEMKKIFLSQYQYNDNKVGLYIPTIAIYELVSYLYIGQVQETHHERCRDY